ncbi:MAG: aconitate hydratase [candidate division Zixibacteria bacterium]|nr:aconitate hydratase [candidate division Zixibacteria bacterium]NIR65106.1 aconitate hydratase [candidate division Zixibacteria bacterium]NIS17840.1 aconitate hydratase [candidate division Zixibacteria bacterium]NIS46850.1 aconitate hydratase [candidate division Zixibacteria bacterium]NIT54562.1 aconitate hydratase [candidate division Zixibacteria bacterium]
MALTLTYKILKKHLVDGELTAGKEIGIKIDQTLTQDATGTMSYLQFEALGMKQVKTKLSVSYVDHNTLQSGFENADDHRYLQSVASKYGILFSRPGNGICHQVHLERFAVPGWTLLGSDSHTPTSGGLGMIAIGAGGLDVAVAMGGGAFYLPCPRVVGVKLTGKLKPWVTAKDIILKVLEELTVKGGVGNIIEYFGPGVKTLTVPERATITNMGAELGATTSIFPSDEQTERFLKAQERPKVYKPMTADDGAEYDKVVEINLDKLVPLIAQPHSPDNVVPVSKVAGKEVHQVCIGSCTNSSIKDLRVVGKVLSGKAVNPNLSMTISPGSQQVLRMASEDGSLTNMIAAGARILESACGPCIGMGQAPPSGGVSVRSFNRNFPGRSGTKDAQVYLASPETCVATAIKGKITDPRKLGEYPRITMPKRFIIDDRNIIKPSKNPDKVEVERGPNIAPVPVRGKMEDTISAKLLLHLEDNITTDHIMPAGARILPLRSNIPAISDFVFHYIDQDFPRRAKEAGSSAVVGGENYGQGSSREHAALAPMYLGLKFVIAKSFARIHKTNLVNFGILPLTFKNAKDYDRLEPGDELVIKNVTSSLKKGEDMEVENKTRDFSFPVSYELSDRQVKILLAGGLLNYTKKAQG